VRGSEIWQLVDVANEAHFITTTGAHCSIAEKEAGIRPARILEGATDCVLTQKRLSALELVECIRIGIAAGAVAGAPARPAAPVAMAGIESHVRHEKAKQVGELVLRQQKQKVTLAHPGSTASRMGEAYSAIGTCRAVGRSMPRAS
jgi:hypothetical protein